MPTTTDIHQILKDIDNLNYTDKLNILSHIVIMLKKTNVKPSVCLADLKGLGKDLWKNRDIDAYLAKERDSWD
jgi:hypothetical protein